MPHGMAWTDSTYATFKPREIERLTGISTSLQRDWRRRGLLPKKGDGWSNFDTEDLVNLTVAKLAIDRGMAASTALYIAQSAHLALLGFVLQRSTEFAPNVPLKNRKTLADKITKRSSSRIFKRFLVVANEPEGAAERLVRTDDISKAFDLWRDRELEVGAAIVIDLVAVAEMIVKRADRPLCSVTLADQQPNKPKTKP